jgi:formate dehydrogenase subunit beta
MNTNRVLQTHSEGTAKAFQHFLGGFWKQAELDAVLAPVEFPGNGGVAPKVLRSPGEVNRINPFVPLMLSNSAGLVEAFLMEFPQGNLAAVLRPCELRALVELRKRNRVHFHSPSANGRGGQLTLIGVDCPGTFAAREFAKHVAERRDDADMIKIGVSYEGQQSFDAREVRTACQMCDSPAPLGADITIGTIGLAPREEMLVIAQDERVDAKLRLRDLTDGPATEEEVVSREQMVGKLASMRAQKRGAATSAKTEPGDESEFPLALFACCTLCADCLDACPLYFGQLSGMLGVNEAYKGSSLLLSELVNLSRWLASCSGCGMCQEACQNGVALTHFVTNLSQRIQRQLHYHPGDPAQPLPWSV